MLVLKNVGKTLDEVRKILNRSKRTVQRQLKKIWETCSFLNLEKQGRPKHITEEIGNQVGDWIEEDRRNTASKLSKLMQERFGVDVHVSNYKDF
jgi:transposase